MHEAQSLILKSVRLFGMSQTPVLLRRDPGRAAVGAVVSSTPATRPDVVNLQKNLDKALQARQARETGICPIREELYSQCFDELIREVRGCARCTPSASTS